MTFRFGADVAREPALLEGFDRVVFATGARYRFGLGSVAPALLRAGAGRWPLMRRALATPGLRDWFYHRARRASGEDLLRLARPGQTVMVIGDARQAGKGKAAIASAFAAALLGDADWQSKE